MSVGRSQRMVSTLVALLATGGCAPTVALPVPAELAVIQRDPGTVEVSWQLVVRVDGYLLHYGEQPGQPLVGTGLQLVQWPEGCGDFDTPLLAADSPVRIVEAWCLDEPPVHGDATPEISRTPGKRPRVRLQNLQPAKSYTFAVQSFRGESTSVLSGAVSVTMGGTDAGL